MFRNRLRYLLEIFSISLSHDCAKMMQKFWPLLNQPACYGPYRPKFWTPLATVFVEIFWNEKNWGCFRPYWVAPWKEFMISWKKQRFESFWTTAPSRASGSWFGIIVTKRAVWFFGTLAASVSEFLGENYQGTLWTQSQATTIRTRRWFKSFPINKVFPKLS